MTDLLLDDDQRRLRALAHEFARDVIRPVAAHHDRTGEWPGGVLEAAWEAGLRNVSVPQEFGGSGCGALSACLISEELAWGCAGMATSITNNDLGAGPVVLAGSDHLKREYLTRLVAGPAIAAFCLTEPGAGSDVAALRTRAVRQGDRYVLNGSKCFITNGGHADWFTVFARTGPGEGHRGLSAFVVERDDTVVIDKSEDKLGHRASNTATVTFNDTEIPARNLLGEEGRGFGVAMGTLDRTRPGVAAQSVGIARAAFEHAVEHSKVRTENGVPVAMNQFVQFAVADMATEIEAARLLTWSSALQIDAGARATLASSHAKRFAADTAMKVATEAVQIYGPAGLSREQPVEKLMRDAKLMQLYEGTSQIQRLVIAREIYLPREPVAAPA